MQRACVLLLLLFATAARATTSTGGGPKDGVAIPHDPALVAISIVDAAAAGATAFQLIAGERNGALSGLTIVATVPVVLVGVDLLDQDANDPAVWTTTLAAGALFTYAIVDIVRRHLGPGTPYKQIEVPTLVLVPLVDKADGGTRVTLALGGRF